MLLDWTKFITFVLQLGDIIENTFVPHFGTYAHFTLRSETQLILNLTNYRFVANSVKLRSTKIYSF